MAEVEAKAMELEVPTADVNDVITPVLSLESLEEIQDPAVEKIDQKDAEEFPPNRPEAELQNHASEHCGGKHRAPELVRTERCRSYRYGEIRLFPLHLRVHDD